MTGLSARRDKTGVAWEDWDLWIRLARAGARFRTVPVKTWEYRLGKWSPATWSQDTTPPQFRLLEARYGAGQTFADVTATVVSHVANGTLILYATNEMLGGDPAVNQLKELQITYLIDGHIARRSFVEGSALALP